MKSSTILIMTLAFFGLIHAQEKSYGSFTFNHLALSVKDVNRSAGFYSKVLNLQEITNRTEWEGIRWFSMGEGKELHLISIIKEPVSTNKAVHLALTTHDFDAFIKTLENENIPYSDWPGKVNTVNIRTDGIKQIWIQDPDGYWIEVNSVAQN